MPLRALLQHHGAVLPQGRSRGLGVARRRQGLHRLLRLTRPFARRPAGALARQRWLAAERATASSTRFQAPRLSPIRRAAWATRWLIRATFTVAVQDVDFAPRLGRYLGSSARATDRGPFGCQPSAARASEAASRTLQSLSSHAAL